jgi:hypothetical protein
MPVQGGRQLGGGANKDGVGARCDPAADAAHGVLQGRSGGGQRGRTGGHRSRPGRIPGQANGVRHAEPVDDVRGLMARVGIEHGHERPGDVGVEGAFVEKVQRLDPERLQHPPQRPPGLDIQKLLGRHEHHPPLGPQHLQRLLEEQRIQVKAPMRRPIPRPIRRPLGLTQRAQPHIGRIADDPVKPLTRRHQKVRLPNLDLGHMGQAPTRRRRPRRVQFDTHHLRHRPAALRAMTNDAFEKQAVAAPRIEQPLARPGRPPRKEPLDHVVDQRFGGGDETSGHWGLRDAWRRVGQRWGCSGGWGRVARGGDGRTIHRQRTVRTTRTRLGA